MRPAVLKLGGTSVGTPAALTAAAAVVREARREQPLVVVTSALAGVTDQLESAVARAADADRSSDEGLEELATRCREQVAAVAGGAEAARALRLVDERLTRLEELLAEVRRRRHAAPALHDEVVSYGERLAAPLVVAALEAAGVHAVERDARELLRTDSSFGEAAVDLEASRRAIRGRLLPCGEEVPVVGGFFGADGAGRTTLLGRGASDYTATILGAALGASRVDIWTDVDGVLTADPRRVRDTRPVPRLDYVEAAEAALFGAKVLHPRAMSPVERASVPVHVVNTFNPSAAGTWIDDRGAREPEPACAAQTFDPSAGGTWSDRGAREREPARVVASLAGVSCLELDLHQLPALLRLLERHRVSVLLLQAAGSLARVVVARSQVARVRPALAGEPPLSGLAGGIRAVDDHSLVAVIGRGVTASLGAVRAALEEAGAGPSWLAIGRAGTSVAGLVPSERLDTAAEALHARLALKRRRLRVVLAGASGRVGRAFVDQLSRQQEALARCGIDVRLAGAFNRSRQLWDAQSLPPARLDTALAAAEPRPDDSLPRGLEASSPGTVLVDCTASATLGEHYPRLLERGISVVTPNKQAGAAPAASYGRLRAAARLGAGAFLDSATVGAGLPILATLRQLHERGDELLRFEGVLSGTMAFVFARLAGGERFSAALAQAWRLGYTEPDPRDDLRGEDVARKLLIILRAAGLDLCREQVVVSSLVSAAARAATGAGELFTALAGEDAGWAARAAAACACGTRLALVAWYEDGRAGVGVRAEPVDSPLVRARAGENVAVIWSQGYRDLPLTISGPGAGPEITARSLLGDIVTLASRSAGGS